MDTAGKLVARAGARARAVVAGDETPDRSYRLHTGEHVPDGVRRIARGQLVEAHEELSRASGRKLATAVHATRKRLKRLRALVRVARDAVGEQSYERENAAFRTAGRRLSASRDAQVLLETLDALRERFAEELPGHVTDALRSRLVQERGRAEASLRDHDTDTAAVLGELTEAIARTPGWTFESPDFGALSPGLRRIYRRGRKAMRAARKDPSPANLHECRKRVKDLWHATQIVREAEPKRLKKLSRRAHDVADLLGDANDLSVLRDYVQGHPQCFADETSLHALLAVVDRRADVLRVRALKRGRKLYERSPKRFVRRIERGWSANAPKSAPPPLAG
jgi:CHAD domain-containing protein